ncbi:hypothetical protein GCM10023063_18470 [Arthrobacter methylotrophus]|uniref:Uncharacterized protein n=1 Tax=Arthrobacter methylotrophus TaxID=121291 RepID=A0ABV5UP03_9MICC
MSSESNTCMPSRRGLFEIERELLTAATESTPVVAHLVAVPDLEADITEELPRCKGCNTRMRPQGTTESQYPGTFPAWGDNQCRVCDYVACGKDPADRFISVERVGYLTSLRTSIERDRQRRGIPAEGSLAGRTPITEFLEQIS